MKVLEAAGKVAVADVARTPKFYVRGRFKMDYAQNLADVARDAMANADKSLDMARWPFNDPRKPILIRRVIREAKDAKSGKVTMDQQLIGLDGNHRMEAARILKLTHVPARIIECSDKEAALAQLAANIDQGLFLDRSSRNAYIKAMLDDKDLHVTQKEVAAITHLTPASINRILKGIQGKRSASSRRAARKTRKTGKAGARVSTGFRTNVWFSELVSVAGDFDQHHVQIITAAKGKAFKVSEAFREFCGDLKSAE